MTRQKIETLVPKASVAIKAMCVGLKKQSKRSDFEIEMSTFLQRSILGKVCFGCASTCAIQEVTGIDIKPVQLDPAYGYVRNTERSKIFGMSDYSYHEFEVAMDEARTGDLRRLFRFYRKHCDLDYRGFKASGLLPMLESDTWKEGLPAYEHLVGDLEAYEHNVEALS